MNILHVTDLYIRSGGGLPNVIKELSAQHIQHGHNVHVLTFKYQDEWPDEEDMNGVIVHRTLPKSGLLPFHVSGYRNMQQLARQVFESFTPDILHLHMPFSGSAVMAVVSSAIPMVYTFHGSWPEEYDVEAQGLKRQLGIYKLEKQWMHALEKKVLHQSDAITTLSQFMQDSAKQYKPSPKHGWHIIPSGVDLDRFHPLPEDKRLELRETLGIPKQVFWVLCVRRLVRRMGLENLIASIDQVKERIPAVYLTIGGKGPLNDALQAEIEKRNLSDRVTLTGFISDEELPEYFAAADLFVLPTESLEGFGLINLESLASGTTVLGTPVGAIPEVLEPFNPDFVLEGTSVKDITHGIVNYYESYYQRDIQSIRSQARGYAENFSWSKIASEYEKIYQDVCAE